VLHEGITEEENLRVLTSFGSTSAYAFPTPENYSSQKRLKNREGRLKRILRNKIFSIVVANCSFYLSWALSNSL